MWIGSTANFIKWTTKPKAKNSQLLTGNSRWASVASECVQVSQTEREEPWAGRKPLGLSPMPAEIPGGQQEALSFYTKVLFGAAVMQSVSLSWGDEVPVNCVLIPKWYRKLRPLSSYGHPYAPLEWTVRLECCCPLTTRHADILDPRGRDKVRAEKQGSILLNRSFPF